MIRMILAALAATFLATAARAGADVEIHHPYAITTGMGGAIYFAIHNHGDAPDRLIGASSPAAAMLQIHQSKEDANGVMTMTEVAGGLALPQGADITLAPGGYHIMLMGLVKPLKPGDTISVTLTFETTPPMTFDVPVQAPGAMFQPKATDDN
ncbi:MAG: copper chaperone PCu(A)C [Limimaricola sp.]|uniref:copper chaperone PCu(A)C n=1 Tax=Limimaricola sp. TaxID=2211665 RepID=UPI001D25C8E4|nr:copper chaperone PCu(A)C [Limimaricola sp.]MBI1415768.1 copper chaperone PCu(A)C [Limimaricola sp.]